MKAFRIKKHIMSTSIDIPEFQNYIGKHAEIIILIENTNELENQFVHEHENKKEIRKGITAKDLIQLPIDKRKTIITKQFKEAITLYNENPELIIEDVDSYIEYGNESL